MMEIIESAAEMHRRRRGGLAAYHHALIVSLSLGVACSGPQTRVRSHCALQTTSYTLPHTIDVSFTEPEIVCSCTNSTPPCITLRSDFCHVPGGVLHHQKYQSIGTSVRFGDLVPTGRTSNLPTKCEERLSCSDIRSVRHRRAARTLSIKMRPPALCI